MLTSTPHVASCPPQVDVPGQSAEENGRAPGPVNPVEAPDLRNGEHTGRLRVSAGSLAVLLPVTSRGTSEEALDKTLRALAHSLPDGARVEVSPPTAVKLCLQSFGPHRSGEMGLWIPLQH